MNSMVRPRRACRSVQQVEDLRLDGDVERGRGLVEDQQFRLGRKRAGDQRALAHAAGQLVRVGLRDRRRIRDPDLVRGVRSRAQRRARAEKPR